MFRFQFPRLRFLLIFSILVPSWIIIISDFLLLILVNFNFQVFVRGKNNLKLIP